MPMTPDENSAFAVPRYCLTRGDIVIALGKAWKRGNRDETVKLLDGIQRV